MANELASLIQQYGNVGDPGPNSPGPAQIAPSIQSGDNAIADASQQLDEIGKTKQMNLEGPPVKKQSTKFNDDGTVTHSWELSNSGQEWIQQMIGIAQTAIQEKNKLTAQLAAKRDVLEAHPAIAQIGKILSLAATAYQAPDSRGAPLVHAAGAYAGEYFQDSPESLQASIAQNEASKMAVAGPIYNAIASEEHLKRQEATDEARQRRFDARQEEAQRRTNLIQQEAIIKDGLSNAKQGAYAEGEITQSLTTAFPDDPDIKAKAAAAEARAKTAAINFNKEQDEKRTRDLKDRKAILEQEHNYRTSEEILRDSLQRQREIASAKGAPALQTGLGVVEQRFGALSDKANTAVQTLEAERLGMVAAGIPGFEDASMTPKQLTQKLLNVYNGLTTVPGEKKGTTTKAREQLGIYEPKDVAEATKRISEAGADYTTYEQRKPQLEQEHKLYRKGLEKLGINVGALTPEQQNREAANQKEFAGARGAALREKPPPPPAVKQVTAAELDKMSLDEMNAAIKADRVPASLSPQVKAKIEAEKNKKKPGTQITLKDALSIPANLGGQLARGPQNIFETIFGK